MCCAGSYLAHSKTTFNAAVIFMIVLFTAPIIVKGFSLAMSCWTMFTVVLPEMFTGILYNILTTYTVNGRQSMFLAVLKTVGTRIAVFISVLVVALVVVPVLLFLITVFLAILFRKYPAFKVGIVIASIMRVIIINGFRKQLSYAEKTAYCEEFTIILFGLYLAPSFRYFLEKYWIGVPVKDQGKTSKEQKDEMLEKADRTRKIVDFCIMSLVFLTVAYDRLNGNYPMDETGYDVITKLYGNIVTVISMMVFPYILDTISSPVENWNVLANYATANLGIDVETFMSFFDTFRSVGNFASTAVEAVKVLMGAPPTPPDEIVGAIPAARARVSVLSDILSEANPKEKVWWTRSSIRWIGMFAMVILFMSYSTSNYPISPLSSFWYVLVTTENTFWSLSYESNLFTVNSVFWVKYCESSVGFFTLFYNSVGILLDICINHAPRKWKVFIVLVLCQDILLIMDTRKVREALNAFQTTVNGFSITLDIVHKTYFITTGGQKTKLRQGLCVVGEHVRPVVAYAIPSLVSSENQNFLGLYLCYLDTKLFQPLRCMLRKHQGKCIFFGVFTSLFWISFGILLFCHIVVPFFFVFLPIVVLVLAFPVTIIFAVKYFNIKTFCFLVVEVPKLLARLVAWVQAELRVLARLVSWVQEAVLRLPARLVAWVQAKRDICRTELIKYSTPRKQTLQERGFWKAFSTVTVEQTRSQRLAGRIANLI